MVKTLLPLLPAINASFNALSTLLLLAGYVAIRRGQVLWHRRCMLGALASSALFLVGYLTRMANTGAHRFVGPAPWRLCYLVLLVSHMILAVLVLPLIFRALQLAFAGDFVRHRRVTRWAYPIWLYVSVTGVVVYYMLYWLMPSFVGL